MPKIRIAWSMTCLALVFTLGCTSDESAPQAGTTPAKGKPNLEALQKAVTATVGQLSGEAKTQHDAARQAEPFPNQQELIVGTFHGSFQDNGFASNYQYERSADGTASHVSIDRYSEDKEYIKRETDFRWMAEGRVIYEQNVAQPELVYVLLLEEVNDNGLRYKLIDPEIGLGEISDNQDARGPGELPELPDGWTQVED